LMAAVDSSEMTKLSPTNARIRNGMRESKNNRNDASDKTNATRTRPGAQAVRIYNEVAM